MQEFIVGVTAVNSDSVITRALQTACVLCIIERSISDEPMDSADEVGSESLV